MALTSADFHYLTILRELEKETTRLHGRKKASERGQAHRTSRVFRDLFGELSTKVEGANITVKLRASAELLLDTELACAKVLRELTEGRPSLDRLAAGDWPPVVPPARMVERFTALTIGMHSEDPSQPLAVHAARAFHEAVLPALAWGVVSHLYELPEHLREDAQKALAKYFKGKPLPHLAELEVGVDEKLPFLYLRMVEAWFAMLTTAKDSAPWCCSAESCPKHAPDWPLGSRSRLRTSTPGSGRPSLNNIPGKSPARNGPASWNRLVGIPTAPRASSAIACSSSWRPTIRCFGSFAS